MGRYAFGRLGFFSSVKKDEQEGEPCDRLSHYGLTQRNEGIRCTQANSIILFSNSYSQGAGKNPAAVAVREMFGAKCWPN